MKQKALSVFLTLWMMVSVMSAMTVTASAAVTLDGFYWPLSNETRISSGFGAGRSGSYHQGIDIPASAGTPIYAAKNGTVFAAGRNSSMGNYVCISHGTLSDGTQLRTTYMHMNATPSVRKGQYVTVNTRLGVVGSTGNSTGPHLHFQIFHCKSTSGSCSPSHTTKQQLNNYYFDPSPSNISYVYRNSGNSAKTLTISLTTKPTTITQGKSFGLYGTVTSGSSITSVRGYVINSRNETVLSSADTPNSTSMNINTANLNKKLTFNSLAPGNYTLKIVAADKTGKSETFTQGFTVVSSYAKISGNNAPSALKVGQSYSLKGKITSSTKITSVTAGVYTSSSGTNCLTGKTVSPNSTSYNLTAIDRYVLFGRLSAGTYYYRVTATNSAGTAVLVNHKFTVASKLPTTWFMLAPKCAPQSRMDVCGGGTESRVNVQLYQSNGTNAQYWYLHDLGNGYYALSSCVSGKYLDVDISNRTSSSDANVWQYQWNGSNAQQWKLIDAGGGYYYLASRLLPDFYLDVSGAGTANGTNIQVYKRNYTDAQKWMFC